VVRAFEPQRAFARIVGENDGAQPVRARFIVAAQACQQVGQHAGQQVVLRELRRRHQGLHQGQRRGRPLGLAQRHGAVERHHRGWNPEQNEADEQSRDAMAALVVEWGGRAGIVPRGGE